MRLTVFLIVSLLSTTAGAGSRLGLNFKLRCTQNSDHFVVEVKAESKSQIESMRAAMLRKGTIGIEDSCILTVKTN